jgi:cytochrome c-type biogenesis protein CcmE
MALKGRHRRFAWIGAGVVLLAAAAALVLNAFQSNLVFFYTPTQVFANEVPKGRAFRIGGLVEPGSVVRSSSGVEVHFRVTDHAKAIPVTYGGILPDLFKEGKGVVAQGTLNGEGIFVASQVLAKHDENYMPPEAAEALRKAGHPVGVPEQFVDKARASVKN